MRPLKEIIKLILRPGLRRSLVEVFFLFFLVILLTATVFYITGEEMMIQKFNRGVVFDESTYPDEVLESFVMSRISHSTRQQKKSLSEKDSKLLDDFLKKISTDISNTFDKGEFDLALKRYLDSALVGRGDPIYITPLDPTALNDLSQTHMSPARVFGVFSNKPEVLLIPLLLVILAFLMAPRILKPVKELTKAAENLTTGDWDSPIKVEERDEIAKLANAFDIMRETLREKVNNLEMTTQELAKELAEKNVTLDRAKLLQRRLVPDYYEKGQLKVATGFMPMEEMGGDFVDMQDIGGGRIAFIFGDVEGHGVPSSFNMMSVLTVFRLRIHEKMSPTEIAGEINRMICRDREFPDSTYTATALTGVIDINQGTIEIVNSGHPNPILWSSKTNACYEITEGNPVLGISEEYLFKSVTITIVENDKLLLFTDGLIWLTDNDGNYFGAERLMDILAQDHDLTVEQIITRITERIRRFKAPHQTHEDDILFSVFALEPEAWSYLQIPPGTKDEVIDDIIRHLEREHIPNHIISDFRLAMDELITNALAHGIKGDPTRKIHIRYTISRGEIRMRIRDEGEGFKHDSKTFLLDSANIYEAGHRGLYLVKAIMDEMVYNEKGNEVTIVKKIRDV